MSISRRSFIGGAAAAGAFNIIPAKVLWGAEAPSNQLTRARDGTKDGYVRTFCTQQLDICR